MRLPAQPLADALSEVARQTDTDVLFQPGVVSGLRSRPLSGRMSAEHAVARLLAGTALEVVRDADGALIVRRRPAAPLEEPGATRHAGEFTRFPELIVTATKREGVLRLTPMSVSMLDETRLDAATLVSARDIPRYTPGLNMTETNTGQRRITIRGIQSSGETTVGFYLDETPITAPSTATADPSAMTPDINLYDIARVEVLRGPQGTLYGSGSLSGALRILPNPADPDVFSAEIETGAYLVESGGVGSTLRGYVNAPVIDGVLGVRVAAFAENSAGYIDNVYLGLSDVNAVETRGVRAHATLNLSRNATLSLLGMHQRQNVEDTDFWYPEIGVNKTDNRIRLPFSNELSLYNLTLTAEPGGVAFTGAISAYAWNATRFIDSTRPALSVIEPATHCALYFDLSGACDAAQADAYRAFIAATLPVVGVQPMGVEAQTQEFRFSSADGGAFDWTLGVFREHRTDHSVSSAVRADPLTGYALEPLQPVFLRETALEIIQEAVFGEITYRPDDHWAITLGARGYRYEKQTDSQVLQTSYLTGARAGPPASVRSEDDGWVTRANVSYRPTHDTIAYVQFAEGFRPGGANTAPGLPPQFETYASDGVRSYEIGARTSLGQDWLDLHVSLYRIDWRAMQMMMQIPNFRYVANLGASRIEGAEIELETRPSDHLTLRLALSALLGRLTEAAGAGGMPGDRIPYEPNARVFLGARYAWAVTSGLEGALSVDYAYVGEAASEFNATMPYYERMGDYSVVDAEISFASPYWRLAIWGANLLDAVGEAHVQSAVNAERFTLGIRPRTFGVSISRTF